MKRIAAVFFLTAAVFLTAQPVQAEMYGYGQNYGSSSFDSAWYGMYGTGGTNLYGWGYDMANAAQYMNSGTSSWYGGNWGGSCSSLYTPCSGGYDYANLQGGFMPLITIDIYLASGYSSCGGSYSGGYGSSCGGGNYNYMGCGQCNYGMTCGNHGYPSYPGYPSYQPSYPPTYPGYPPYYGSTPTFNPLPTNPYLPGPVIVDISLPPSLPPWGGCGNMVQCPGGPTNPPTQPPQAPTPTYTYQDNTVGQDPIRYRVDRGVHGGI